jgi:hypothetical protein
MTISGDDAPRSLRDPAARQRRVALLAAPHMQPLNTFVAKLRLRPNVEVPDFDPLDGGVRARALFLFEKPGPMTSDASAGRRQGSGFISRNNDDPTAEAAHAFMLKAGIPRELTVSWNVIPWWNGTRKISGIELREGASHVRDLISILPELRVVVLVGRKAARARRYLTDVKLEIFQSDHPSPIVRAAMPERWRNIPDHWAQIKAPLGLA